MKRVVVVFQRRYVSRQTGHDGRRAKRPYAMVVLASEGERAWRQRELNLNEELRVRALDNTSICLSRVLRPRQQLSAKGVYLRLSELRAVSGKKRLGFTNYANDCSLV